MKESRARADAAGRAALAEAREARRAKRSNMAMALLTGLLAMIAVGLEAAGWGAAGWAPLAMVMAPGPGLEGLKPALGRCRKAAAVKGGFCEVASGQAAWPSWRPNMQFWRWGWPGWGRGLLGANGRVTLPPGGYGRKKGKRPPGPRREPDLATGARAYKVLLPLREW
jgi:hypothetical protein